VVANVVVDISGRNMYKFTKLQTIPRVAYDKEGYNFESAEHLFESLSMHLGMNLNITLNHLSTDLHTTLEPMFKALGIALDQATQIDPRRRGIPSTKGVID
jgi:imidazoleglycerol-phosphate dehydratase